MAHLTEWAQLTWENKKCKSVVEVTALSWGGFLGALRDPYFIADRGNCVIMHSTLTLAGAIDP